jgi:hypothetical protein
MIWTINKPYSDKMFVMKCDGEVKFIPEHKEETESTWSQEKKLFVFGKPTVYLSLPELEAMNDREGRLNRLIRLHREGRPVSKEEAQWRKSISFILGPSHWDSKQRQWEAEHEENEEMKCT